MGGNLAPPAPIPSLLWIPPSRGLPSVLYQAFPATGARRLFRSLTGIEPLSLIIPPFSQFQGQLIPLRGLWNSAPLEGDRFINAEIDWITATGGLQAIQLAVGGNSPVALSQIAALFVDNSRCGSDVSFLFPDSGFELVVPAHSQVLSPVLSNALQFYAIAKNAAAGDVSILQILNSVPPPIPITPSTLQSTAFATAVTFAAGNTQIVPVGVNGTLEYISINLDVQTAGTAGAVDIVLLDQTHTLWSVPINLPINSTANLPFNVGPLNVRFTGGIVFTIGPVTGFTGNFASVSLYYSTP